MRRKIYYTVLIMVFLWINSAFGQDVSFSQFYSNPLSENPAFAGSIGIPRVTLQYRNQWSGFDNAFASYSASFDLPVKKIQGGLGFNILNDVQAGGALNSFQMNMAYSTYIRLSKNYMLLGGLQAGVHQNSLNINELIFADNLDAYTGNHGTSGELVALTNNNKTFIDFSTGILLYSKMLFYGISVNHLNEPLQSYYSDNEGSSKLHRKYTAHFGARLPVYLYGNQRKSFDISPNVILQKQGGFYQLSYGMFATKWSFTAGGWFRQNFGIQYDSVILSLGFFKRSWQCTYSYDFTVSGLSGYSGGTSEISLSFLINEKNINKNLPFYNRYFEEFGVR